jgi:putative two-component system response regulator
MEIRGFEMGALDFIYKPFSPPILIRRIETHIDTDVLIKKSQQAVRSIHNATIKVLADVVESRDKITGGHIVRTQKYLEILVNGLVKSGVYAKEMSEWKMELLTPSAQLHDVGKIKVSDLILNKPGKLTDDEYEIIKIHCSEGEKIIDRIIAETEDDGFLNHAKMFAGCHHEKWNGKGYPRGLAAEDIPLQGRIMAIADVDDALVSERPYKKPFTHEQAVEIIRKDAGAHFDPKLVEVFLSVAADFWVAAMRASVR